MAMSAEEALERLKSGNAEFVKASTNTGDISQDLVKQLSEEGQAPYACVITCADSRVVPEHIFMAGLGELFTIRVAGNLVGGIELGSCLYAAEHLGVKLIVLLGHTQCGAVASALEVLARGAELKDAMGPLLAGMIAGISEERDPYAASVANTRRGASIIKGNGDIARLVRSTGLKVVPALYHTETGVVEFME